jgi:flagellar hook-associated protein 3 FlgL
MIRISTNMIFNQGVTNMQNRTAELLKTQDQIANGRRILTPADDPVASARSLEVEQSQSITQQYQRNADSATTSLGLSENALASVTTLLQDVKTTAVNAGDGALSEKELATLGNELRGRYQELIGLANSTDGNGQYLFSGYQGSTTPFSETSSGVVAYQGDQGTRRTQITASRQVAVSDAGSDIFQLIKNGNGTFATGASAGNTGMGIVDPGTVIDPAAWNTAGNPRDFTIKFNVDNTPIPPVTTYDIVDNTTGNSLLTGAPSGAGPYTRTYSDGASISLKSQGAEPAFDFGAQTSIKGQPVTGDTFTLKASTNVDVFKTLNDMITAMQSANRTATGNTKLANDLNVGLSNIDNSLDNVLRVRAAVGVRLQEIDTAKSSGADLVLQYSQTLSGLRDLDYAKAISTLTLQQTTLQAAQQSFAKVQGLSLFNFL